MKLTEIRPMAGVYVGLRVLDPANSQLVEFAEENKISNPSTTKERRLHVTTIYSRRWAPLVPDAARHLARPLAWRTFVAQGGKRCLVLQLSAPSVQRRHRQLMSLYPLTFDYEVFIPHITLSYDAGDLDLGALPPFQEDVWLGDEYVEELRID